MQGADEARLCKAPMRRACARRRWGVPVQGADAARHCKAPFKGPTLHRMPVLLRIVAVLQRPHAPKTQGRAAHPREDPPFGGPCRGTLMCMFRNGTRSFERLYEEGEGWGVPLFRV